VARASALIVAESRAAGRFAPMLAQRLSLTLLAVFFVAPLATLARSAARSMPGVEYEDGELRFHQQFGSIPSRRGERFVEIQWGAARWDSDGAVPSMPRPIGRCEQRVETAWPVDSACVLDGRSLLVTGLDGDDVVIERWEFAGPESATMREDRQVVVPIELASRSTVVRFEHSPQRRIASLVAVRRADLPTTHVLALGAATPRAWQMDLATHELETLASGDSTEGRFGLVPYFHEVLHGGFDARADSELGAVYFFQRDFGCVIDLHQGEQSGFRLIDGDRDGRIDRVQRWTFLDAWPDVARERQLRADAKRASNR